MSERLEQLEAELSAMRPRSMSPRLAGELSAVMRRPAGRPWSDRLLVFAMSVGALAACIIIALLIFESTYAPPVPGQAVVARSAQCSDDVYAFARFSSAWGEICN